MSGLMDGSVPNYIHSHLGGYIMKMKIDEIMRPAIRDYQHLCCKRLFGMEHLNCCAEGDCPMQLDEVPGSSEVVYGIGEYLQRGI